MPRVVEEEMEPELAAEREHGAGIFRALEAEHSRVDALLRRLATAEGAARRELFTRVARELAAQARAKEDVLYPALREVEEAADLVDESVEDYAAIAELIEELRAMDADSEAFSELCDMLTLELRDHVDVEENELFPLAEEVVGDARAVELEARYRVRRREILGRAA